MFSSFVKVVAVDRNAIGHVRSWSCEVFTMKSCRSSSNSVSSNCTKFYATEFCAMSTSLALTTQTWGLLTTVTIRLHSVVCYDNEVKLLKR